MKNCPVVQQSTAHAHTSGDGNEETNVTDAWLERRLQLHVLKQSNPMVRPVLKKEDPVVVTFGFSLIQV